MQLLVKVWYNLVISDPFLLDKSTDELPELTGSFFSLIILIGYVRVPPSCVSSSFSAMLALRLSCTSVEHSGYHQGGRPSWLSRCTEAVAVTAIINNGVKPMADDRYALNWGRDQHELDLEHHSRDGKHCSNH